MTAILMVSPATVFPTWLFWIATAIALIAVGIGPLASWVRTTRMARALIAALVTAGVFVFIVIDCLGLPEWFCYLLP